jgi:hypothetical protein
MQYAAVDTMGSEDKIAEKMADKWGFASQGPKPRTNMLESAHAALKLVSKHLATVSQSPRYLSRIWQRCHTMHQALFNTRTGSWCPFLGPYIV